MNTRPLRAAAPAAGLLLLLALAASSPDARRAAAQEPGECVPVPAGVVGWWRAEGNAEDSARDNEGTNSGGYAEGRVGQAFDFRAAGEVVVPDDESLNVQELTLDAWVQVSTYPCAGSCGAFIVAKSGADGQTGYEFGTLPDGRLRFTLNGGAGGADLTGTAVVADADFHHVAATYADQVMTIYVDGQVDATKTLTGFGPISYAAGQPLRAGSRGLAGGSTVRWPGLVDELEVFGRALTETEIQSLFNAGAAGKCRAASAGQLIISEFRFRGTGGAEPESAAAPCAKGGAATTRRPAARRGAAPAAVDPTDGDEFIELYNDSESELVVSTNDGSEGWALTAEAATVAARGPAAVAAQFAVLAVIPNGTRIPARAHLLVANADGYSLFAYPACVGTTATPDLTYTDIDIPNDGGVALFNTADATLFSAATRLDAAGFASPPRRAPAGARTGALPHASDPVFYEGTPLSNSVGTDSDHSFVRRLTGGLPQDTDNNAADFVLVSTDLGDIQDATLGAPGPENLSSPLLANSLVKSRLIDATKGRAAEPNRERVSCALSPFCNSSTAQEGTLTIRRRFTNITPQSVTRLRVRVVDITTDTTDGPAAGAADLRVLSSGDVGVSSSDPAVCGEQPTPCALSVRGTQLEEPPSQFAGGGLNSSLSLDLTAAPIPPGGSVDLQMMLGVMQPGSFRFFGNVEALFETPPTEGVKPRTRSKQKLTGDRDGARAPRKQAQGRK